MSNSDEEEPKSWPVDAEGESVASDAAFERLRREIASARRVLDDHREKLSAIAKPRPPAERDRGESPD